jgi:hypothetical protein
LVPITGKVSIWLFIAGLSQVAYSQTSSSSLSNTDTVLDPSPFASCRAAGMGGALSTLADQLDALYYNPAGIGGLGLNTKSDGSSMVKSLYFPYAAGSLNQNAGTVRSEFNAQQAQNDANTGAAIIDAQSGKRQFARASIVPLGLFIGNTAIVPVVDHQLAAVPVGDDSGQVKLRYRSFTGVMVGASASDKSKRVLLGVSQAYGNIEETSGTFNYVDTVDSYQRKKILKENRSGFAAKSLNAGITIRVPKAANPAFSLVARNLGNTKNTASNSEDEPLTYEEDLTAGFSISPALGKIGRVNFILEGGYLTQKHMAARKKIRSGLELLLGEGYSKSPLGIRVGGNDAGWSAGIHLNVGLIGVEASTNAVDIGINNHREIERRTTAIIYIDLGSM